VPGGGGAAATNISPREEMFRTVAVTQRPSHLRRAGRITGVRPSLAFMSRTGCSCCCVRQPHGLNCVAKFETPTVQRAPLTRKYDVCAPELRRRIERDRPADAAGFEGLAKLGAELAAYDPDDASVENAVPCVFTTAMEASDRHERDGWISMHGMRTELLAEQAGILPRTAEHVEIAANTSLILQKILLQNPVHDLGKAR
jgi:hypothetical protein